jgi:MoxR-like ATPase
VHVDDSIVTYVRRLAEATREHPHVRVGASPRGALALVRVAKVWAAADGRSHVVPQDVADLCLPVLNHRLILRPEATFSDVEVDGLVREVVDSVAAPSGRSS